MFDVAVVGAGIAGISCAQQLRQWGYRVVVVEKSRGLGGRIATRRVQDTCADYGARHLSAQGEHLAQLIPVLCENQILRTWTDTVYELGSDRHLHAPQPQDIYPRYTAPAGMSAIAKFLATGLDIQRSQRVEAIALPPENTWQLTLANPSDPAATPTMLAAQAVVVAIPAPQALTLLKPLEQIIPADKFFKTLRAVQYHPCITAIAGYARDRQADLASHAPPWQAVTCPGDSIIDWISLENSKRPSQVSEPQPPTFVIQSSAAFAQKNLETSDLPEVGCQLLDYAAQVLFSWLDAPDWLQVHRWRYAFPDQFWPAPFLSAPDALPLVCSGDWCGGGQIESALESGLAAAAEINRQLRNLPLPETSFWHTIPSHSVDSTG
ncbi:FAD-dependent oxidoreductase [Trichocoleus sp. FACHB-262]|uniref:NAD(P)/FAD-dependent oxidoreductase n=1 Tax=Trichocoleus sp. FACHB-262 TaxID=2692869 RepID=UPI001685A467|nr:FAD-dependent oxidoreductase [Trichocoleus sp. FACHB-262]MBD2119825.1 FAD-dependent oxidoreductase [Trichocoleus sp. FACHB-262]